MSRPLNYTRSADRFLDVRSARENANSARNLLHPPCRYDMNTLSALSLRRHPPDPPSRRIILPLPETYHMLTIFSKAHKKGGFCDGVNRRDFLTIGGSILGGL